MKMVFLLLASPEHTRAHASDAGLLFLKSPRRVPPTPTEDQGSTAGHCGKSKERIKNQPIFRLRVSAIEMTSPSARRAATLARRGVCVFQGC